LGLYCSNRDSVYFKIFFLRDCDRSKVKENKQSFNFRVKLLVFKWQFSLFF